MKESFIEILRNPFVDCDGNKRRQWMVSGLGMLQLKLDDERCERLHIWNKDLQIQNVTDIHTHPWDYHSEVLYGILKNTIYEEISLTSSIYSEQYEKVTIKCGTGECAKSKPKSVHLAEQKYTYHTPLYNDSYSLKKSQIHKVNFADGTVTLLHRYNHDPENKADIFYKDAIGFISVDFRSATDDEVKATAKKVLEMMGC